MPQDYVGSYSAAKGNELLHHGIKGQKWGVRRPKGAGGLVKKSAAGSGHATAKTNHLANAKSKSQPLKKAEAHTGDSSIDRYARLKAEVKKNGAHKLSDDDLRFYNNRTDAVRKANQTFNKKGSFLEKAVKLALAGVATKLLNDVAQTAVNTHVKPALLTSLKLATPS